MYIELIRHGLSVLQEKHCYQGFLNSPLSERGRLMLSRAPYAADPVYVSPLLRTQETASLLFPGAQQIPVPGLKEMNFGVFEGRPLSELENDPRYRKWVDSLCLDRCPGGESKEEYCRRVCDSFSSLVTAALREHRDRLVIVAHGGTQMAVLEAYAGDRQLYYEWQLPPGHGYSLEVLTWGDEKRLRVASVRNYTSA